MEFSTKFAIVLDEVHIPEQSGHRFRHSLPAISAGPACGADDHNPKLQVGRAYCHLIHGKH